MTLVCFLRISGQLQALRGASFGDQVPVGAAPAEAEWQAGRFRDRVRASATRVRGRSLLPGGRSRSLPSRRQPRVQLTGQRGRHHGPHSRQALHFPGNCWEHHYSALDFGGNFSNSKWGKYSTPSLPLSCDRYKKYFPRSECRDN